MIIKGLFRRYERWNPVHPTSGAFWGMGIGIGCGVGWGPGFGPEVIGYVGAGCGIGFNVGITLAGLGIGLPTNDLIGAPYKALVSTSSHAMELARSSNLISPRSIIDDNWNLRIAPFISGFQQKAKDGIEDFDLKSAISSQKKSVLECWRALGNRFSNPCKDIKD